MPSINVYRCHHVVYSRFISTIQTDTQHMNMHTPNPISVMMSCPHVILYIYIITLQTHWPDTDDPPSLLLVEEVDLALLVLLDGGSGLLHALHFAFNLIKTDFHRLSLSSSLSTGYLYFRCTELNIVSLKSAINNMHLHRMPFITLGSKMFL